MIKSYNEENKEELKKNIIKLQGSGDIEWNSKLNKCNTIKSPFFIGGTDFNWNYQYKFSSLAQLPESGHLMDDIFRLTNENIVFMVAARYRLFKPITPLTYLQSNYNKNIKYYAEYPAIIFGNTSFCYNTVLIKHDTSLTIPQNTKIAELIAVFVNTNGIATQKHARSGNIMDTNNEYLQKQKREIINASKYIDECIKNTKNQSKHLHSVEFNVSFCDIDRNFHLNQSFYIRNIENCLYEYDIKFFKGYWYIHEILCNWRKEIKLDGCDDKTYKISKANISIIKSEILNNNTKIIIGIITQYNIICNNFKVILASSNISNSHL